MYKYTENKQWLWKYLMRLLHLIRDNVSLSVQLADEDRSA